MDREYFKLALSLQKLKFGSRSEALQGTGHNRSLLERCVLASGRHQFRLRLRFHFEKHVYHSLQ